MMDTPNSRLPKPLLDNWISVFGFMLAVAFLSCEAVIMAVDLAYGMDNPYVGILIYIVMPSILVFGLLLVPFGMWLEHRKRQRGLPDKKFPVFDPNNRRHRKYLVVFISVTTVFLTLTMIGSYQAYHVTESVRFCGTLCHQVMTPEFTAYQVSPHARVACVQCHIGPGAGWFVKSKLSGAGQVYAVLTNTYHLPISSPVKNLRPARDTCEQCHWPDKFYSAVEKSLVYYGNDKENTPYRVDLLLNVGGISGAGKQAKGIHWHVALDHKLEYYALDESRQNIPWVRVTRDNGTVEEFVKPDVKGFDPAKIPADKIRTLDCIDCHNRPSHRFQSPFFTVNEAMKFGRIDPKLPEIKSILVKALQAEYKTTNEAISAIEKQVREHYADWIAQNPAAKAQVDQAIEEAKRIFAQNSFPEWGGANWTKYPSHIGHFEFPGCYRCHDDQHKTAQGKTIRNDCNLCHTIIRQGEGWDTIAKLEYKEQPFVHPRDLGDGWKGQNCHECHGPGMM